MSFGAQPAAPRGCEPGDVGDADEPATAPARARGRPARTPRRDRRVEAVDGTGIDLDPPATVVTWKTASGRWTVPSRTRASAGPFTSTGSAPALRLDDAFDPRAHASQQRSIGRRRPDRRQRVEQRHREGAADSRRGRSPSPARTTDTPKARCGPSGSAATWRPRPGSRRSGAPSHSRTSFRSYSGAASGSGSHWRAVAPAVARPVPRVAAVEDHHDVRPARRRLGDQHGELLVRRAGGSARPASPAAVAGSGSASCRSPQRRELRRCRFLAPVAAVREERHVARAGLPEMRAEGVDHRRTRRLTIEQVRRGAAGRRSDPRGTPSGARRRSCTRTAGIGDGYPSMPTTSAKTVLPAACASRILPCCVGHVRAGPAPNAERAGSGGWLPTSTTTSGSSSRPARGRPTTSMRRPPTG